MALRRRQAARDALGDLCGLNANPFRVTQFYNPDQPGHYAPAMYGEQLREFHEKFFVAPIEGAVRPTIGAVWSSHEGENEGRGFGKSMLMCEESRRVNRDLGAGILLQNGASEEDARDNPFLASYCTFDQARVIQSFPATLLEGVAFALRCPNGSGGTVHGELRRRISHNLGVTPYDAAEAIRRALIEHLGSIGGLGVQLSQKAISGFIDALCQDSPELVDEFIRDRIGPRVRTAQGFNFVHVFNAFARIAGIVHVVYFVDQVENFAKWARRQDREVRVLREAMRHTSPTADMASFVFQMHVNALRVIEPIWRAEQLPSLDAYLPINSLRIVHLQGLCSTEEAVAFASELLATERKAGPPRDALHPFDPHTIGLVRKSVAGNPRQFLERLGAVIDHACVPSNVSHAFTRGGLLNFAFVRAIVDPEGAGGGGDTDDAGDDTEAMDEGAFDFANPVR